MDQSRKIAKHKSEEQHSRLSEHNPALASPESKPSPDAALEATSLSARYGPRENWSISDVTIALYPGELLAVIGPNGAGKTSLIRAITGLLPIEHGDIRILGTPIAKTNRRSIAKLIAVVPQQSQIAFEFSVQQVVAMGRAPHQGSMLVPSKIDEETVNSVLERTNLSHLANKPVSQLSGGEQQRVAIARAIAQQPKILILDEATAHLDIHQKMELIEIVKTEIHQNNLACLAIMHDINDVSLHANRVAILNKGRITSQGPVNQIMTANNLQLAFDVDIDIATSQFSKTRVFIPSLPQKNRHNQTTTKKLPQDLDYSANPSL